MVFGGLSKKGVRLAHKMQVDPCILVETQLEKAAVDPTSGPTWYLSLYQRERRGADHGAAGFVHRRRPAAVLLVPALRAVRQAAAAAVQLGEVRAPVGECLRVDFFVALRPRVLAAPGVITPRHPRGPKVGNIH
jgi:hypothetical protein